MNGLNWGSVWFQSNATEKTSRLQAKPLPFPGYMGTSCGSYPNLVLNSGSLMVEQSKTVSWCDQGEVLMIYAMKQKWFNLIKPIDLSSKLKKF